MLFAAARAALAADADDAVDARRPSRGLGVATVRTTSSDGTGGDGSVATELGEATVEPRRGARAPCASLTRAGVAAVLGERAAPPPLAAALRAARAGLCRTSGDGNVATESGVPAAEPRRGMRAPSSPLASDGAAAVLGERAEPPLRATAEPRASRDGLHRSGDFAGELSRDGTAPTSLSVRPALRRAAAAAALT